MKMYFLFIVVTYSCSAIRQEWDLQPDFETQRISMIVDIITLNFKKNGWSTILCFGIFPDEFYNKLQNLSYAFAITNMDKDDADIGDVVRYYANTIILNLQDIEEYEDSILKLKDSPYWHPHSNIILYYHQKDLNNLPKLYFSLWYYKAINAIIVQYDDTQEMLLISHYTPFTSDDYKLDHIHGCWTTRKIGLPVLGFHEGFTCEQNCQNVSITSKYRANYLGTCIGFSIIEVPFNAFEILPTIKLFPDKTENLHGFQFRAYATEAKPFLLVTDHGNGSYTLGSRDGMIWNSISKLMNFKIDLTPSKDVVKKPFNFEVNIKQLFAFAFRKSDLYLGPIYLFDVAVVELDYVYPYKESGVCIVSHQAGYVTTLFDINTFHANQNITIKFILCFLCVWVTFAMYQVVEKGQLSFDQIGKDFLNALRNVLLITLCKPPKRRSFRIFLTISIWSYFVINFAMQASIISFFTVAKKGKRVETFEDVIDKGYLLYGMASPDLFLPDTEEKFRIINSRLVPVRELYECVEALAHDSHIFCLVDCSVAHYLERNLLNEDGEQYLNILKDRIHSHYLTILQTKHSALTNQFAKYMLAFYEAGLIKKWEQYKFNDIKEDPPVKPLAMEDFKSFFYVYAVSVGLLFILFLMELLIFNLRKILQRRLNKVNDTVAAAALATLVGGAKPPSTTDGARTRHEQWDAGAAITQSYRDHSEGHTLK